MARDIYYSIYNLIKHRATKFIMGIRNFTLTEEQASQAKAIYFPGAEEETKLLQFKDRYDNRPTPMIVYSVREVPRSTVQITLHEFRPLIHHIDLMGEESDMEKIIHAVDIDLGIELARAIPLP